MHIALAIERERVPKLRSEFARWMDAYSAVLRTRTYNQVVATEGTFRLLAAIVSHLEYLANRDA